MAIRELNCFLCVDPAGVNVVYTTQFWRIGEPPKDTNYPQLNANPVVPAGAQIARRIY